MCSSDLIHHEESHRCGDNGRNRRDSKDLRINILHDFACFLPNCGRRRRLAEQYRHTGCNIAHIQTAANVRPLLRRGAGGSVLLFQIIDLLFDRPAENENSTRIHECCSVPFQGRKKDAIGAPDTAVFSCRYSFEHVHFNIYRFTAQ